MNEEEITCLNCGDDKYTTSRRILMIEAFRTCPYCGEDKYTIPWRRIKNEEEITCPNCGDDKYTTVTMQEAYGMDTHIGHCDDCDHRWNEDAR